MVALQVLALCNMEKYGNYEGVKKAPRGEKRAEGRIDQTLLRLKNGVDHGEHQWDQLEKQDRQQQGKQDSQDQL